jgi:uncharacterized protein (UPF0216 family)
MVHTKVKVRLIKNGLTKEKEIAIDVRKVLQSEMADIRRRFNSFVLGMEQKLDRLERIFKEDQRSD